MAVRFSKNASGASAVEFALVLPILLGLYVGMTEIAHAIDNWRKVTLLARTLADLVSKGDQQNPMSAATLSDILSSATAVLRPFSTTGLRIVVSAMAVDSNNATASPRVCSSAANANATARSVGVAADLTTPLEFAQSGNRFVLAEVGMTYLPIMGNALTTLVGGINGAFNMRVSIPWPVRGGQTYGSNTYSEVILPGGAQC